MKKCKKILSIILVIVCVFIVFAILNKILLKIEEEELAPPGEFIELEDKTKIHVYTEGQSEKTLVFLAGWGVTAPVYEYKSLYSHISDEYKIVVIEKPGYGYSDETNTSRTLENIVEEYRYALNNIEVEAPYIIVAHSASGMEALHWLEKYPEEIELIASLDMVLPEQNLQNKLYYEENIVSIKVQDVINLLGVKCGIIRLPIIANQSVQEDYMTSEDLKQAKLLWYKNANSDNAVAEKEDIYLGNRIIAEENLNYNIPFINFISSFILNDEEIKQIHTEFTSRFEKNKIVQLPSATHLMYRTDYENIAKEIKHFIKNNIQ